jgi:hypothetical protein
LINRNTTTYLNLYLGLDITIGQVIPTGFGLG